MTISVFFKKTAMVKLAFLDRSMPVQQHSNSLPLKRSSDGALAFLTPKISLITKGTDRNRCT